MHQQVPVESSPDKQTIIYPDKSHGIVFDFFILRRVGETCFQTQTQVQRTTYPPLLPSLSFNYTTTNTGIRSHPLKPKHNSIYPHRTLKDVSPLK